MKNKYFLSMLFLCASIGLIAQTTVWKSEVEANWVQAAPGDTAFWTNGTPTMFAGSKAVLNVPSMGDCHVVSDTASCRQLVAGDNSPMGGKLIIKDGGVLTVGVDNDSWTGVAYNNSGWMVVEAGGTVVSNQRMHVGMLAAKADTCVAILDVAGTVNVTKNIFSIDNNGWTGQTAEVWIRAGGVLMAPNFRMGPNSKMDVAGGLVIIGGDRDSALNAYKTDGRLTGEEGFEPPTITVHYGWDTVTVISTSTSPEFVGVNDRVAAAEKLGVYPNPAKDVVYFTGAERADVKIYSITGQLVLTREDVSEISVESLTSGLYFVEAKSNGQIFVDKLLIK